MKSPIQLIEQIIRAKMALHLRLVAAGKNGGQGEVGGWRIEEMIVEVDAGRARYEQMLVCFKNELAAAAMMASMDAEDGFDPSAEASDPGQDP